MRDIKFSLYDAQIKIIFPNGTIESYPYILVKDTDQTIVIDIPNEQRPKDMQLGKDSIAVSFPKIQTI